MIWLFLLYVLRASSIISTRFFVLNLMVELVYCLTNLLFLDIPLLYCYINLKSSIIFCVSSGDIYLSLGISFIMLICNCIWIILLWSFWCFCNFVRDFITNWITNALFEAVSCASVHFLAWSRSFWLYLLLKFLFICLPIFLPLLLAKDKNQQSFANIL